MKIETTFSFGPGDIIEILNGPSDGRLYLIEAVCLGSLHQESVLHLSPIELRDPDAYGKKQEMYVPVAMVEAGISAGIFIYTEIPF